MEEFLELILSNQEMKLLHRWRIFFQVNALSDLMSPGQSKGQSVFLKNKHNDIGNKLCTSRLNWPIQGNPSKKGFTLWVKCLLECFNVQKSGQIYYQLGNWIDEIANNTNLWNTYYHPATSFIFIKKTRLLKTIYCV